MIVAVGQPAPDFEQDTLNGSIRFLDWIGGSWCVLFSQGGCSRSQCDAELTEVSDLKPEWDKRGVKVVGLFVEADAIVAQRGRDREDARDQRPNFPIVADADRSVATLYGMTGTQPQSPLTEHSLFVIDPHGKIQLIQRDPPSGRRRFADILRSVDRLRLAEAVPCGR